MVLSLLCLLVVWNLVRLILLLGTARPLGVKMVFVAVDLIFIATCGLYLQIPLRLKPLFLFCPVIALVFLVNVIFVLSKLVSSLLVRLLTKEFNYVCSSANG